MSLPCSLSLHPACIICITGSENGGHLICPMKLGRGLIGLSWPYWCLPKHGELLGSSNVVHEMGVSFLMQRMLHLNGCHLGPCLWSCFGLRRLLQDSACE